MTNSSNASNKGGITAKGMLPKHVFKRLLPTRQRPKSPPPTANGGTGRRYPATRQRVTNHGIITPAPEYDVSGVSKQKPKPIRLSPFYLQTGFATWAKRASRPFPPPFVSTPTTSFSDPLTTHSSLRDRRPAVDGEFILGVTNGDDAVLVTENYMVVDDGVGAWAAKPRGHAALWSRLVAHFWAMELERWMNKQPINQPNDGLAKPIAIDVTKLPQKPDGKVVDGEKPDNGSKESTDGDRPSTATSDKRGSQIASILASTVAEPEVVSFLQTAFEKTESITKAANGIVGTTTFVSAFLHYQPSPNDHSKIDPILYITGLGDSTVILIRPERSEVFYRFKEQWHWFDCPRQLGTNSPDSAEENAVMDKVEVSEGDIVLAVSDGVVDNLWEHEVCEIVCDSLRNWQHYQEVKRAKVEGRDAPADMPKRKQSQNSHFEDHPVVELEGDDDAGMVFVAREVVRCARAIAEDNSAESPFMERAVDEGLPFEGGKMDDISVAIGMVTKRKEIG